MTLALITYRNGPKDMGSQTSVLLFYVGGIAAITLVVNATTANSMLFALGLLGNNESTEKHIIMASMQKKLRKHMRQALEDMAMEFHFNEKELEEVRQSVSLLADVNISEIMASAASQKMEKEQKIQRKNSMRSDRPLVPFPIERPEATASPLHSDGEAALTSSALAHASLPRHRRSFDRHSGHGSAVYGMIPEDEEAKGEGFDGIEMTEAHSSRPSRSRGSSSADMHRRLSMSARAPSAEVMPQLLAYVRSTFLSMVRVHYWHDIEQGKLPRKSKSGKFLLYSIEVGLDEVNLEAGGRDWACVEEKLDSVPNEIKVLLWLESNLPENMFTYPSRYLNKLECNREERTVYILTSFIAAHESAQRKIHGYLRVDDEGEADFQSPEELKVIAESKLAVSLAGE